VQLPDAARAACRDQDIVELLQSGARAAAFEMLVARYERKIYRLCCAMLRDRGLAEDAAQESLLRIWKALDHWDPDRRASLSTWIYAITRNRSLTAIARRRAAEVADGTAQRHAEPGAGGAGAGGAGTGVAGAGVAGAGGAGAGVAGVGVAGAGGAGTGVAWAGASGAGVAGAVAACADVAWAGATAADAAEDDERAALLRALVDALPDRYRCAVTLYYFEERSITEAALMLGVPEGTVKTHLSRARALLLARIDALGLADPLHWLRGA